MNIFSVHTRERRFQKKYVKAYGLFLVQDFNHGQSLLKASLDYHILQYRRLIVDKNHSVQYHLLPMSSRLHDSSAKEHTLSKELTPTQLKVLRYYGPNAEEDHWRATVSSETTQNEANSNEPSIMDSNEQGKMVMTSRELGKGKLRKTETSTMKASIRFTHFFQAIQQVNLISLSFILDDEPTLITNATHPENGYSPLILAMLTRPKMKQRLLLHLMIRKLSNVVTDLVGDNAICDRVLQSHDTMFGRDCIAWACLLGLLPELNALFNILVVSINFYKPDFLGETYLHLAVRSKSLKLVKWLTSRMYELRLPCTKSTNYTGYTTLDVAYQTKATKIADYLKKTDQRFFEYLQSRRRENGDDKVNKIV